MMRSDFFNIMQKISSKDNNLIKHIKKLKEKKYRDEFGEYIIEGLKLVKEAIEENVDIIYIVVCDGCEKMEMIENHLRYEMARYECIYVPQNIFKNISDAQSPQGILAVVKKKNTENKIDCSTDIIVASIFDRDGSNFLNKKYISPESSNKYNNNHILTQKYGSATFI